MNKKLIFLGSFMIILSISLFLYNKYEDNYAKVKSQETLKEIEEVFNSNIIEESNISNQEIKVVTIEGYDYIGMISIPSLELELPIMNNCNYEQMKISSCRYYGSIYTDDLVLCSHSYDNLFGKIKDLKKGDNLILTDMYQTNYIYEVELIEILKPTDIEKMIESDYDLTLYTCTFDNQNRITVRLNKIIV